jgi:hypothetical protein
MWLIALMALAGGQPAAPAGARTLATEAQVDPFPEVATKDAVPVRIYVRNLMSRRYRLVEAKVVLDETEVVHETARPGQELERSFSALETVVPPGEHALTATFVYEARHRSGEDDEPDRYQVQTAYPFALEAVDEAFVHLVAHERSRGSVPVPGKLVLEAVSTPGSGVTPVPSVTTPSGRNIVKSPPP